MAAIIDGIGSPCSWALARYRSLPIRTYLIVRANFSP